MRLFGPLPIAHPSEPRDRRDGGHLRSKGLRIERTERGLHGSRRKRDVSDFSTQNWCYLRRTKYIRPGQRITEQYLEVSESLTSRGEGRNGGDEDGEVLGRVRAS